jgi:hypothetical protein
LHSFVFSAPTESDENTSVGGALERPLGSIKVVIYEAMLAQGGGVFDNQTKSTDTSQTLCVKEGEREIAKNQYCIHASFPSLIDFSCSDILLR